jgi:hypothetical protein
MVIDLRREYLSRFGISGWGKPYSLYGEAHSARKNLRGETTGVDSRAIQITREGLSTNDVGWHPHQLYRAWYMPGSVHK